jgi:hypothetical protein
MLVESMRKFNFGLGITFHFFAFFVFSITIPTCGSKRNKKSRIPRLGRHMHASNPSILRNNE